MDFKTFLSILSTQVYFNFDQFRTISSLYSSIDDFQENFEMVFSKEDIVKIKKLKVFDSVYKIYEHCLNNKIKITHIYKEDYPKNFLYLKAPPLFLSYKGSLQMFRKSFSVVGSREPSHRVKDWIQDQLTEVCKEGYGIISGAARGVDQYAHFACLRAKQPTLAFLPSGLNQIYPYDFKKYEESIIESGGALISEYEPNRKILPAYFAQRNRMIASLGLLTFICEARLRSGTSMTARLAIENSKTICVLPSFPSEACNAGGMNLLFEGAFPIRDSKDLIVLLEAEILKSNLN